MEMMLDNASLQKLTRLGQRFPKAGRSALNKLGRSTRSFISSEIRQTYNIKKSDLDPTIKVFPARGQDLQVILRATGSRIKLLLFGARQNRSGITVTVKKKKRRIIKGGFIATMPSGHENVFLRRGESRLPIRSLFGPSVVQLFSSGYMRGRVQDFVHERLGTILRQELKHFLSQT
jgi:hypothetical protein